MNILFLSHYFPPEVNAPASRTYEHCREWVKQGNQVTVITCFPNHPNGVVYKGYKNRLYQKETVDGIQVIRLWTYLAANEGFAQRILNYLSFMVMAVLLCFKAPKADVVVSTSPQFFCGLAGYFVSFFKRAKWVLEIRDLWPESIVAVGAMKKGLMIRLLYRLELFCYRAADAIVAVTDSFKDYMVKRGIDPEKIRVIKNGVSLDIYDINDTPEILAKVDQFKAEYQLNDKFVAAYVGTHGMAHHLETLLQAAKLIKDCPNIVFLLVGDGAERENLLKLRKDLGVESQVVMVKQLPKAMMPVVWRASKVSIVHLRKSPTFESVIPSKIFESLAMKKPILHGVQGESAVLVNKSQGGICFEPESAAQLAQAVKDLYLNPQRLTEMSEAGREFVLEHYNRTKLAEDFLALFDEVYSTGKLSGAASR